MKSNVDLELSFNSWDKTIKETLSTPKSAIFADSESHEWIGCQVSLVKNIISKLIDNGSVLFSV